jgi:hypothetical protein
MFRFTGAQRDFPFFLILRQHADDHGQKFLQGGADIRGRVTNAVRKLGISRMHIQHGEHRYNHGRDDEPFGGAARHERVDNSGHDYDHQTKRQKTDISSTQGFCTSNGDHFKDIGFIHHVDEDRSHHSRRQKGNRFPQTGGNKARNILPLLDFPCCHTIRQARGNKEEGNEGNDASKERRFRQETAIFLGKML